MKKNKKNFMISEHWTVYTIFSWNNAYDKYLLSENIF